MSAKPNVERKVRWALALLVVIILAIPVLAVRSYLAKVGESNILANQGPTDERLVAINGHPLLVPPEGLEQTMADWLKSEDGKTLSFELSDQSFAANSASPSPITAKRSREVVKLTQASPTLMVHILMPTHFASAAVQKLDDERAASFRKTLIADGIGDSKIDIGEEQHNLATAKTAQIAVLLTK
jgi:hypothetical protein